jgi:glutathione S-transferase
MATRYVLHGIYLSGPTYKVGLMLTLTGIPFDYEHLNMMQGAHKQPDFLAKNRYGQAPCLEDRETGRGMCQSSAILEYLAETSGKFLGADAAERQVAREWVCWSNDRLARGIYRPRGLRFGFMKAHEEVGAHYTNEGKAALAELDRHLAGKTWLAGGAAPTFADLDVYGVAAYAPQAGYDFADTPNVKAWMGRVEALPGFRGVEDLLPKESRAA